MYNLYSSPATLNAAGQEEPRWQCTSGALPATLEKTTAVHSWSPLLHCTPQQLLSPPLARNFLCPTACQQQSGTGVSSVSMSKDETRSHSSIGGNLFVYLKVKCSSINAVEWKKEMVTTSGYVPAHKKGRGKKTRKDIKRQKGFNHFLVFQRFGELPEEHTAGCQATDRGQGCPAPCCPSAHGVLLLHNSTGSPKGHLLHLPWWHSREWELLSTGRVGAGSMCILSAG